MQPSRGGREHLSKDGAPQRIFLLHHLLCLLTLPVAGLHSSRDSVKDMAAGNTAHPSLNGCQLGIHPKTGAAQISVERNRDTADIASANQQQGPTQLTCRVPPVWASMVAAVCEAVWLAAKRRCMRCLQQRLGLDQRRACRSLHKLYRTAKPCWMFSKAPGRDLAHALSRTLTLSHRARAAAGLPTCSPG